MNQAHEKYVPGFRFAVRLGGNYGRVCFLRISGIERRMDYEEIYEGGNNDAPHLAAVPHRSHVPLILERGIAPQGSWAARLKPGMRLGTWLEVVLLDEGGRETGQTFRISDGIVTRWEIAGFDAMKSEILIERLEIMHEGIQPSGGAGRTVIG